MKEPVLQILPSPVYQVMASELEPGDTIQATDLMPGDTDMGWRLVNPWLAGVVIPPEGLGSTPIIRPVSQ
jgi:hypothetical protein